MNERRDDVTGRLLAFVMPGFMHGLGNSVFAVTSHARLLGGTESQIARVRGHIQRAADTAQAALEVMNFLLGDVVDRPAPKQAGLLLRALVELLKIPCRERGLGLRLAHTSVESPALVDAVTLTQLVVETACALASVVPSGYRGTLDIDLAAQRRDGVTLTLAVQQEADLLPLPLDLQRVVAEVQRRVKDGGEILRASSKQLRLRVPSLRERTDGPREAVAATRSAP